MKKKIVKWEIKEEVWDYGYEDNLFYEVHYRAKEDIEEIIKDNKVANGIERKNLKIKRIKRKLNKPNPQ